MPITYLYNGIKIEKSALQETAKRKGEASVYEITTPSHPIGKGSFGAVYAATVTCCYSSYQGPALVIKVQAYSGSEQKRLELKQELKQEAAFFERVHGGPVRYACPREGGWSYLVMKRMPGKTLHDVMGDHRISWLVKLKLLDQVFATLHSQVHNKLIVHGDLSGNNIMVDLRKDGSFNISVIDFGLFTQYTGRTVARIAANNTYHHPERTIARGQQDTAPPATAQPYQDVYSLCYALSHWGRNAAKFAEFLRPVYRQAPPKPTIKQVRHAIHQAYTVAREKELKKIQNKFTQFVNRLSLWQSYKLFKLVLLNDQSQLRAFLNENGSGVLQHVELKKLDCHLQQFVHDNRTNHIDQYCEDAFREFARQLEPKERYELVKLILLDDQPQLRTFLAQRDAGKFKHVSLEELKFKLEDFYHRYRDESLRRYCCASEHSISIAYGSTEQIRDCLPEHFKSINDRTLRKAGKR